MLLSRFARRWLRRRPRWLRRLARRWIAPATAVAEDDLAPGAGVQAFLDGETIRQVAYLSGDPGIIDPREDWPGALADAHGVIRDYIRRLQAAITKEASNDRH